MRVRGCAGGPSACPLSPGAEQSPAVMARMARRVWELPCEGHTELQQARAGVDALADLLVELGLPTEPEQLDGALQTALRENPMVYTA